MAIDVGNILKVRGGGAMVHRACKFFCHAHQFRGGGRKFCLGGHSSNIVRAREFFGHAPLLKVKVHACS